MQHILQGRCREKRLEDVSLSSKVSVMGAWMRRVEKMPRELDAFVLYLKIEQATFPEELNE